MTGVEFESLAFAQPALLWLLVVPAVLLAICLIALSLRLRNRQRLTASRTVPRRERLPVVGDLPGWLCLIGAIAFVIVAVAQPSVIGSFLRSGGTDVIVLLDGSASMYVDDAGGTRWQRAVRFLRAMGDSLSWQSDRVALSLFAHIATPQVRLTRDPNTFFFFLDHLTGTSPFRLEDDTTWDTNIALGITWGLRILEKDREINGPSPNAPLFVLVSDGQSWSGTVKESLTRARQRGVPVYVVGVGSPAGGVIPDPRRDVLQAGPIVSRLDRPSLQAIATAGGGEYLELDRLRDTEAANRLVDAIRRRAAGSETTAVRRPVYWEALIAAGGFVVLAVIFLGRRVSLVLHAAAAVIALGVLTRLLR